VSLTILFIHFLDQNKWFLVFQKYPFHLHTVNQGNLLKGY